jgi:hypothetical protein
MPAIDWSDSGVHFLPWIGDSFDEQSHRLLVLGESHYDSEWKDSADYTQRLVQDRCRVRFLTRIARVVAWGEPTDGTDAVWRRIAFYNYIQSLVGDDARIPPSERQWDAAREPFLRVVEKLRPSRVMVLGISPGRLWDHVKENGCAGAEVVVGNESRRVFFVRCGETDVPMLPIAHPSSGRFLYSRWGPWAKQLDMLSSHSLCPSTSV